MQRYFLGLSIILAASIYAYTQRYSLVEIKFAKEFYVLRYDSWTQRLCTLNNTRLAREMEGSLYKSEGGEYFPAGDLIPMVCEQPARSIKAVRLLSIQQLK
jgi:hypothetical protein